MNALEALETCETLLIEFFYIDCPPCKRFEKILREYSDETGIPVVKVDLDVKRFDELSDRFKVTHTPTVVVVHRGDEIGRCVPESKADLARIVAKVPIE